MSSQQIILKSRGSIIASKAYALSPRSVGNR